MAVPTLPESELEVMLCLWRFSEPVRTARLLAAISADKSWTLSTLKVLLARLEAKGFVDCTREGRFTLYSARISEESYRLQETTGLLKRFYRSSAKQMIASLVTDSNLSEDDLSELAALIEKAGEQRVV
ncbi:MAG: BlaI/MecI/CopY family transcriptional regulator [Pygmaiobacter massiliensis]|nr:BlaI/MecI/CopY family transcriptional regulator [Pygmaiobacter massiliensis]